MNEVAAMIVIRNMRLMKMRNDFNETSRELRTLEDSMSKVEEEIAMLNAGPQSELTNLDIGIQLAHKTFYERVIGVRRAMMVSIYKCAIEQDFDVDGSRLLKVYRFFYRNSDHLRRELAFVNVPTDSNALWGIIVLTAIMFLYAAV